MKKKLLFAVGVIIYLLLIWWLAHLVQFDENYPLGELVSGDKVFAYLELNS